MGLLHCGGFGGHGRDCERADEDEEVNTPIWTSIAGSGGERTALN